MIKKTTNKWDKRFLKLAKEISTWSKDPSTQIGAICVSPDKRILSTGYNGFPRGVKDSTDRYSDRSVKYQHVVHAEQNAIFNACYNGISLRDASIYVWGLPVCSECAKGIIQAGIKNVYARENLVDRWEDSCKLAIEMMEEAGIQLWTVK